MFRCDRQAISGVFVMASIIAEVVRKHISGRASKPWDEWLDGQPRQFKRGEDFNGKAMTFAARLRNKAKERGKKVIMSMVDDDTVHAQAVPA